MDVRVVIACPGARIACSGAAFLPAPTARLTDHSQGRSGVRPVAPDAAASDPVAADGWRDADLFTFQRAVAASDLPDAVKVLAMRVALDGRGTTGTGVCVNADGLAEALGCSTRTIWKRLEPLVESWLVQTAKPTRGTSGRPGRRARYRLRVPESCAAVEREPCTRTPDVVCNDEILRVQDPASSRAALPREPRTVTTSVGATSVGPTPEDAAPEAQTTAERIATDLAGTHGWTPEWALRVTNEVLGRATAPVRDPLAYVRKAVNANPSDDYRPTPTPEAFDRAAHAARQAAAGDATRGIAAARAALADAKAGAAT